MDATRPTRMNEEMYQPITVIGWAILKDNRRAILSKRAKLEMSASTRDTAFTPMSLENDIISSCYCTREESRRLLLYLSTKIVLAAGII